MPSTLLAGQAIYGLSDIGYVSGPQVTTVAATGTAQNVGTGDLGPSNNGINAGTFTISANNQPGATVGSINIQAQGTGNDAAAYTSVALYRDSNGNSAFDFGTDTQIGAASGAFPVDDGTLNFAVQTPEQSFALNETRRYFVVVKLGGVPAANGQTFNFRVSSLTVIAPTTAGGTYPSVTMLGLVIIGPTLSPSITQVAAVSASNGDTGPGGNGILAGTFNINNNNLGASTLNSITIKANGTGNDAGIYTQVALYEDTNNNATWEFGIDPPYGTAAVAYPANDGQLSYFGAAVTNFAASESRRYFIVVKLGGATPGLNGDTLMHQVFLLGVGAGTGTLGLPSTNMNGITILGPQLTVAAVVGVAQSVLPGAGVGGNGILAQSFTVTHSTTGSNATLNSITLTANGSGLDNSAYTSVALYEDSNNNSTFELPGDTLYGATLPAFSADNGTATFNSVQVFTPAQVRRYLIVVKLGGNPIPVDGQTFNYSADISVAAGVAKVGAPTAVLNGLSINGPRLTVTVTPGVAQNVYANATGTGGAGIVGGVFSIGNTNSTTGTLTSITLGSAGTGNDLTAYTQVALYHDANDNSVFEPLTDAVVGTTLAAFSADNGTAAFTPSASIGAFAAAQAKRFFIVVKLNGSPLPAPGLTFNYTVSSLSVTASTLTGGTFPSAQMNGLVILAPSFALTDSPLAQVTAYRGLGDYVLQKFSAAYAAGPDNSLGSLTFTASGTGNDLTGYAYVRLYHDSNNNGTYDSATDTQVQSLAAFTGDNGQAVFTLTGAASTFSATSSKTYFVVAGFNNTPLHGATFQTRLTAAATGYGGTTFTPALPSPAGGPTPGAVVNLPQYTITDNSNPAVTNAFLGDSGFTLQAFTVAYGAGPNNVIGALTVTASGSGNDLADYAALHLYLDDPLAGTPASFDAADLLVDTQAAFSADNGTATFAVTGPASQFAASQSRQFFVIADFNQSGVNATTFASAVTNLTGGDFGATNAGLPAGPSAGLNLLDANLVASFNGPGVAITVNSDDQGVNDEGLLLCDVTLRTGPGSGWAINQMVFVGTGTGNHATAYADLWLYEDNGNGIWDGPFMDTPAGAPVTSFAAGTSEAAFELLNTATGVNSTRRFFLLGRLSGSAIAGQTLNARLDDVVGTPLVGGSVKGTPTVNSTALLIESTALTVLSGPGTPADLLRQSGTALTYPVLNVRLAASNNSVNVTGITFSNAGTGNFAGDLQAGTGFEVYLDDGDFVFTGADTLLYQGSGANAVAATFSPAVGVPNSGTRDLWVVLNVTATAASGSAVPLTYQTVIGSAADVTAPGGVQVLLGTPAPASNLLRIVDFFVSDFDPVADVPAGGKDITVTGSGFMSPVIVRIDGIVCPGAAVINGGTQITGIEVPPGSGLDRAISIKSGNLPEETITQTFDYIPLATPKVSDGSGCAAGTTTWWPALIALAAILPAARRLRRKA